MNHLRSLFPASALFLLMACSSDPAAPAGSASGAKSGAPTPAGSGASATSSAKPAASTSAAAKPAPSAKTFSKDAKKSLSKHLAEGRKLSKGKDFKAAIKELEQALSASPKDARVLAEIGWAAFGDKDLARAKSSTSEALAHTSDSRLRAQILYTRGRAHEEGGDKEAAKKDYAESLSLRDNADVAKHYAAVGGKADEIVPRFATCSEGYASVKDLCGCLEKKAESVMFVEPQGKLSCEAEPKQDLGDARLSVLKLANEEGLYQAAYFLVAEDGKKLRAVAHIGDAYEPGAFGVHNSFEVKGGKTHAKGAVVAVHHLEEHTDMNMAGLEVCSETYEADTLCVLGQKDTPTFCARTIPVLIASGCGPGVEPEPGDLDPETAEMVKSIKASATHSETKASWSVDDAGKLTVKVTDGKAGDYPKALLEDVALLAKP